MPDRREAIAAMLLHALRKSGVIGRKLQVRTINRHELRQFVEREHSLDEYDPGGNNVDVAGDKRAQRFRHAGFDFEPDDGAASSPLEGAFVEPDQVLRFFFDFDVAIANDAKGALPDYFMAREQQSNKCDDEPIQRHEPSGRPQRPVGQPHETLDTAGNAHEGAHCSSVLWIEQLKRKGETEIGNERKRVRGVDRQGRQNREHVQKEIVLEPVSLATREIGDIEDDDAARSEFGLAGARAYYPAATQRARRRACLSVQAAQPGVRPSSEISVTPEEPDQPTPPREP